ncbi:MAG: NAD(P)H-dependent oxidoreductase subunit E [Desulfobacteraceae bacterium 4484_190.1]|nr:MAG: NAD(P)H-dependent oxidoreductase subunit E [Desulfobacteraceae bacterium 4484_190.1]
MSDVKSAPTQEITADMWKEVDEIIRNHRNKPGALIPVLEECQYVCGYLPMEVQERISRGLKIPGSTIYGVVTFYSFFTMVPRGRNLIRICLGTACYVRGGKANLKFIQDELGIDIGETTDDLRFSLDSVRCLGACGLAPVMVINEDTHGLLKKDHILDILEQYK